MFVATKIGSLVMQLIFFYKTFLSITSYFHVYVYKCAEFHGKLLVLEPGPD